MSKRYGNSLEEKEKDLKFLQEMLDRFQKGCAGDVTETEYVEQMIKDWISEIEDLLKSP